jgi:glycine C-acetyltransferase
LWINIGIHVNGIEFPVVSIGQARLRVNLMPQHTKEHLDMFVSTFERCLVESNKILDKELERLDKIQQDTRSKL